MQRSDRCLVLFNDKAPCLLEKFVQLRAAVSRAAASASDIHNFFFNVFRVGIAERLILQEVNDIRNLLVGNERSLYTGGLGIALRIKEHVALSQQLLRAVHIQYRSRIHTAGNRERDTARHIRLNQTGDDIHAGSLRRNNQMNARRSRQLCQTADRFLNLSGRYHHQIGKLVHDNDDLRHLRGSILRAALLHGLYLLVIALDVSHIIVRKFPVPVFHLRHAPVERCGCLFRIRDNRNQQMWNPVIYTQLNDLRIDHNQLHIVRVRLVQNTHD